MTLLCLLAICVYICPLNNVLFVVDPHCLGYSDANIKGLFLLRLSPCSKALKLSFQTCTFQNIQHILQDLQARDARDQSRASAPLLHTKEAILLDTDHRDIDEAVAFVLKQYASRYQKHRPEQ